MELGDGNVQERLTKRRLSLKVEDYPLTEDTTCGFGPIRGHFLQRLATKNYCVAFFGFVMMCELSSFAYFNGTISTMEKRFKIQSKVTGMIQSGIDISGLFTSAILSYWVGGGHRPKWIAIAALAVAMQMFLTCLPHFIYGPGEDAYRLTLEYGNIHNRSGANVAEVKGENLCRGGEPCIEDYGSAVQPIIIFIGQLLLGLGGTIMYTVGVSYVDDNVKKSESPIFISITFFIRMLGASIGFGVASACLKMFIVPSLTPTITNEDPRWMGAWWLGWIILGVANLLAAIPFCLFPKVLPEAFATKMIKEEQGMAEAKEHAFSPSLKGMWTALKRLYNNKIYFYNNLATIFYCIGEEPYWLYLSKYIEMQYAQSASTANFATGTIGLGAVALGMVLAAIVITKLKTSARTLAMWNVVVGFITVLGLISLVFIECDEMNLSTKDFQVKEGANFTKECNNGCDCDYVPYSPICSENSENYISPCHAGCMKETTKNGVKMFSECSCVDGATGPGSATEGVCAVNCDKPFYLFIAILSLIKFAKATGTAANFLVGVRCIEEKDKSLSMGITVTSINLVLIPTPALFGYLLDTTCLVWGQTCSGTGNCWVYDGKRQAVLLNVTSSALIAVAALFDLKVWKESKHLKIFD